MIPDPAEITSRARCACKIHAPASDFATRKILRCAYDLAELIADSRSPENGRFPRPNRRRQLPGSRDSSKVQPAPVGVLARQQPKGIAESFAQAVVLHDDGVVLFVRQCRRQLGGGQHSPPRGVQEAHQHPAHAWCHVPCKWHGGRRTTRRRCSDLGEAFQVRTKHYRDILWRCEGS